MHVDTTAHFSSLGLFVLQFVTVSPNSTVTVIHADSSRGG